VILVSGGRGECVWSVWIRESSKIEGVGWVGRKRVGVQRESVRGSN
jgi:hypothetical protein